MFKYKNEIIFGLAIVFALKAVATSDWIAAGLSVVFFAAHHIERFWSAESVEAKLSKKVCDVEEALRISISEISNIKLAGGLTNRTFGQRQA